MVDFTPFITLITAFGAGFYSYFFFITPAPDDLAVVFFSFPLSFFSTVASLAFVG